MASGGDYLYYRRVYQDVSTELAVAATDDDQTLITVKNANYTIFVQRIIAYITTSGAFSWSFEDSNSPAKKIAGVTNPPGVDTMWTFDYGEEGLPLTQGKNLLLNVSAAGLAGQIKVYAYQRQTAVVHSTAGASLQ